MALVYLASIFIVFAGLSVLFAITYIAMGGPRDEKIKQSLLLAIALGIVAIALVLVVGVDKGF